MATELADGCWHLPCTGVNAYLLDRDELVLVDAGTPVDAGHLRAGVAAAGHALADVDRVLVTHFDVDHVGGLWRLDGELDAPVHMPEPDAGYLTRTASPPWSLKGLTQRVSRPLARRPGLDVRRVDDGETLAGLTALSAPGHTLGHTVYVDETVAALGDLVVADDGRLGVPPWVMNHDTAAVRASIRTLAGRAPDFDVAAMGHGHPLPSGGGAALRALVDRLA